MTRCKLSKWMKKLYKTKIFKLFQSIKCWVVRIKNELKNATVKYLSNEKEWKNFYFRIWLVSMLIDCLYPKYNQQIFDAVSHIYPLPFLLPFPFHCFWHTLHCQHSPSKDFWRPMLQFLIIYHYYIINILTLIYFKNKWNYTTYRRKWKKQAKNKLQCALLIFWIWPASKKWLAIHALKQPSSVRRFARMDLKVKEDQLFFDLVLLWYFDMLCKFKVNIKFNNAFYAFLFICT